jgi:subtilisin family serine protease
MHRHSLRLLLSGVALTGFAAGCSDQTSDITAPASGLAPLLSKVAGGKYIDGAYIVVLKQSVGNVDGPVNDIIQRFSIKADFRYQHALKGFAGKLPQAVVDALRADPRVAYIEQDQLAHIVTTQSNPTWGLNRIDQRALPLDLAYTYNQTGAGVKAYIIDTGIRFTHVDFGGRASTGYDAITPGGTAADGNGHGTHVAGTVGGGTYGVAKGVNLIAVRVLDNSGSGSYSQVIAGVDWVTQDHLAGQPAVANMSLGGPVSTALDDAVRRSIADGVTYSVAAGNSSANVSTQSPADVAEAITVSATDVNDGFAYFSNFGAGVDLAAPGVSVTSDWFTADNATNTISGTSMASPHVTGAAALYSEANPTATPAQVASGLTSLATTGAITGVPSGTANRLLFSLIGPAAPPPDKPPVPLLSAPADGATGISIPAALSWNPSDRATSYRVQVSNKATGALISDQTVTTTSTSVAGLTANTAYSWQVNASNAGGTSDWSVARSFTTADAPPAVPPAPTLVAPANRATGVSVTPTLSWNAAARATSYRIQVSRSSSFTSLFLDRTGVTATSTTVSGLAPGTRYYWRVNASNAGGISAWSSSRRFTTR